MKTNKCKACQNTDCCPCPECKENKAPLCEELEHKYGLKKWIFKFIFWFVVIGFMGPFIAQCWLSVFATDLQNIHMDGLIMWNQYVGIVLGIVATILSIVSLVMGFHSTSEAYEQQRIAFDQYEATIELLRKVKTDVEDVKSSVGKYLDTSSVAKLNQDESIVAANDIE